MENEIPKITLRSLELYRDERVPPSGFLRAVLANDLSGAILRADMDNLLALRSIVYWINWELFASSWGSYGKVDDWLAEEEYEPRS
tara:strand:+ start:183 stop:440 length:258 start_codon:yes stop_codon:yes gene_type:complete